MKNIKRNIFVLVTFTIWILLDEFIIYITNVNRLSIYWDSVFVLILFILIEGFYVKYKNNKRIKKILDKEREEYKQNCKYNAFGWCYFKTTFKKKFCNGNCKEIMDYDKRKKRIHI